MKLISPREAEILRLVLEGFTHKEIGVRLGISTHTVAASLSHVTMKTGLEGQIRNAVALDRGEIQVKPLAKGASA